MTSRRSFLQSGLAAGAFASLSEAASGQQYRVYIGTYTQRQSKGIYSFILDTGSGELKEEGLMAETENPSFVAIHPSGSYLYSVAELNKYKDENAGALVAFRIDPASGKLERLNDASAGGSGTCHVNVSRNGKFAAVANYGGGSCAAFALEPDGKIGQRTAFHQHTGQVALPQRQGRPHAHSVNFDRQNKHLIVADLGLDEVKVYKFNNSTGAMEPNTPPAAKVAPGSGPRHFSFHPSGKYAYVINEITCTVTGFNWDAKKGVLTEIETLPTLPVPVEPKFSTAEIVVHPNGRFLYGSNRVHNTLVVFQIDPTTGKLKLVEHEPTQGAIPRNFAIDPTGKFLIAANQNSDNIVLFRINQQTGALDAVGAPIPVPVPVCIRFLKLRRG